MNKYKCKMISLITLLFLKKIHLKLYKIVNEQNVYFTLKYLDRPRFNTIPASIDKVKLNTTKSNQSTYIMQLSSSYTSTSLPKLTGLHWLYTCKAIGHALLFMFTDNRNASMRQENKRQYNNGHEKTLLIFYIYVLVVWCRLCVSQP